MKHYILFTLAMLAAIAGSTEETVDKLWALLVALF